MQQLAAHTWQPFEQPGFRVWAQCPSNMPWLDKCLLAGWGQHFGAAGSVVFKGLVGLGCDLEGL